MAWWLRGKCACVQSLILLRWAKYLFVSQQYEAAMFDIDIARAGENENRRAGRIIQSSASAKIWSKLAASGVIFAR